MNKNLLILIFFLAFSCLAVNCKKGCTDNNALNTDFDANKDDGSCRYSSVTFYASASYYNGIPVNKIDITINGSNVGVIPGGTVYFSPPGNCISPGTVAYQFINGNKIDWNSSAYLASGAVIYASGQLSPSSASECIKINVTR